MWSVKSLKGDSEYFILPSEEVSVGRKGVSLLISEDPSVSRKHAVLYVKYHDQRQESVLCVRDENSKFGTSRNGVKLNNQEVVLSEGDVIRFGQLESDYKVCRKPLKVATSCLDTSAKTVLKKSIINLGGCVASDWDPSCTYLVMSQVKITIKALCCLVSLKPIVTPDYFEELKRRIKNSGVFPSASEFIPPIGEPLIIKDKVSFDINPKRAKIFEGKKFMFLDEKQYKRLHIGIALGGGTAHVYSEDMNIDVLSRSGTCVLQPGTEQVASQGLSPLIARAKAVLNLKKLRMIPEPDIGLAVAYCSTERFCNPLFNIGSALFGSQKTSSQGNSQTSLFVQGTQSQQEKNATGEVILQSSIVTNRDDAEVVMNSNRESNKRKLSEDSAEIMPSTSDSSFFIGGKKAKNSFSTLNLSDFPRDKVKAADNSDYGLSAPVKEELDDFFADTVQDDFDFDIVLPTSKTVEKAQENPLQPEKISKSSVVKNGFLSPVKKENKANGIDPVDDEFISMYVNAEEHLPRNLIKVELGSLVFRRPPVSTPSLTFGDDVKNFKKFKKVLPVGARALPKIIGIHELFAHDKETTKDDWEVDDPQQYAATQKRGEFDWESQGT